MGLDRHQRQLDWPNQAPPRQQHRPHLQLVHPEHGPRQRHRLSLPLRQGDRGPFHQEDRRRRDLVGQVHPPLHGQHVGYAVHQRHRVHDRHQDDPVEEGLGHWQGGQTVIGTHLDGVQLILWKISDWTRGRDIVGGNESHHFLHFAHGKRDIQLL